MTCMRLIGRSLLCARALLPASLPHPLFSHAAVTLSISGLTVSPPASPWPSAAPGPSSSIAPPSPTSLSEATSRLRKNLPYYLIIVTSVPASLPHPLFSRVVVTLFVSGLTISPPALPWAELLDRSSFARPTSLSEATCRLRKTLPYCCINYLIVVASVLALSLVSHPGSLLLLLILAAAWIFLYLFRPSDAPPISLFGRTFSDRDYPWTPPLLVPCSRCCKDALITLRGCQWCHSIRGNRCSPWNSVVEGIRSCGL